MNSDKKNENEQMAEKKPVSKKRVKAVARATPEQKKLEETVKQMFLAQGEDYNAWLAEKHQEYVMVSVMNNQENILGMLKGE